uniref:SURF6 domain-containing protein n=1 Tax=Macrostomum lignano TaxID=282301 RepID=A0A1I8JR29_9PLAT
MTGLELALFGLVFTIVVGLAMFAVFRSIQADGRQIDKQLGTIRHRWPHCWRRRAKESKKAAKKAAAKQKKSSCCCCHACCLFNWAVSSRIQLSAALRCVELELDPEIIEVVGSVGPPAVPEQQPQAEVRQRKLSRQSGGKAQQRRCRAQADSLNKDEHSPVVDETIVYPHLKPVIDDVDLRRRSSVDVAEPTLPRWLPLPLLRQRRSYCRQEVKQQKAAQKGKQQQHPLATDLLPQQPPPNRPSPLPMPPTPRWPGPSLSRQLLRRNIKDCADIGGQKAPAKKSGSGGGSGRVNGDSEDDEFLSDGRPAPPPAAASRLSLKAFGGVAPGTAAALRSEAEALRAQLDRQTASGREQLAMAAPIGKGPRRRPGRCCPSGDHARQSQATAYTLMQQEIGRQRLAEALKKSRPVWPESIGDVRRIRSEAEASVEAERARSARQRLRENAAADRSAAGGAAVCQAPSVDPLADPRAEPISWWRAAPPMPKCESHMAPQTLELSMRQSELDSARQQLAKEQQESREVENRLAESLQRLEQPATKRWKACSRALGRQRLSHRLAREASEAADALRQAQNRVWLSRQRRDDPVRSVDGAFAREALQIRGNCSRRNLTGRQRKKQRRAMKKAARAMGGHLGAIKEEAADAPKRNSHWRQEKRRAPKRNSMAPKR